MARGRRLEKSCCRWCQRERSVDFLWRWHGEWQCLDWERCAAAARQRKREEAEERKT